MMSSLFMLKELGFTDGQIRVLLSLYSLGQSTVGPISLASQITHAKVYPILNKLIERGLVSFVIKDGRKHFTANSPFSLLDFVDGKIRLLNDERSKINDIIPSLLEMQKAKEKEQFSRVYEGIKGIRSLFHELFSLRTKPLEICVFGLDDLLRKDEFVSFFRFYHDLRRQNRIRLRLILHRSMKSFVEETYLKSGMYGKNDKIKYISSTYPTGTFLYADHVVTIVSDEIPTAFDTKSKQMFSRYRTFFSEMWIK